MISKLEYFQKPHSDEQDYNAEALLYAVNVLLSEAVNFGIYDWPLDPDTESSISGAKGGDGDGGFRTPGSQTGAVSSQHRQGNAVDVYDPGDKLDAWLDTFEDHGVNSKLREYGLYREAPSATPGWLHLQRVSPGSGRQTFLP